MTDIREKRLSSANAQYISKRLEAITAATHPTEPLRILDLGCGDGTIIKDLLPYGYNLYGYDLSYRSDSLRQKLKEYYSDSFEDHIRLAPDERTIPFEDNFFDVVYANQVFEHVKFFDKMMSECARVLKPGGKLILIFQTAHVWIEPHLYLPGIHFVPQGNYRRWLLTTLARLHLAPRRKGAKPTEYAQTKDKYLQQNVYYRLANEIEQVSLYYFETFHFDDVLYAETRGNYWADSKSSFAEHGQSFVIRHAGNNAKHWLSLLIFGNAFFIENPQKDHLE